MAGAVDNGNNITNGKAQMSPDQMDAMDRMLEGADPAIRAVHAEVRSLKKLMLDENAKIKLDLEKENAKLESQIREGFKSVADRCAATYASCDAKRAACAAMAEDLRIGQAINKTKLSFLIGGSALGGGIGAKLIEWLTSK